MVATPFPHHPELAERFDPHHAPVLLLSSAGPPGEVGRRLAIGDLHLAAKALARHGIDARPHLPSAAELDEMLRSAHPASSGVSAAARTANVVELDLRDQCGVYCAIGSATWPRPTPEGNEAWVDHVASLVRQLLPSLVFVRRLDRLARRAWALGPLTLAMQSAWFGDERMVVRLRDLDDVLALYRPMVHRAAAEERERFQERARLGRQLAKERRQKEQAQLNGHPGQGA